MITHVTLRREAAGLTVVLEGALTAMLGLADRATGAAVSASRCSVKMVAGAGFEPATFRL